MQGASSIYCDCSRDVVCAILNGAVCPLVVLMKVVALVGAVMAPLAGGRVKRPFPHRVSDSADTRVGGVSVRSRGVVHYIVVTLEGFVGLILSLTTRTIDVSLGAPDTSRSAFDVDRIAPVGHSPHAAMLKVGRQVVASSSVTVEAAVLPTPLGDVVTLPLVSAALSHETDAHTRHEDIKTVTTHVTTVVDDLIEERVDPTRLGTLELRNVACAGSVLLGRARHGSKCIADRRIHGISPRLLAAALELVASAATG